MCQLTPEQREAYEDFLGSDLVHKVHTTYYLPLTAYYLLFLGPDLVHKVLTAKAVALCVRD